jgi:hypothetical protein
MSKANNQTVAPVSGMKEFLQKNKDKIGLAILLLYIALLGLGTIGEIWNVEWILDLPIFRPPGKY